MRKILLVHRRTCILNFQQQHQQFDWNKHKRKWNRICSMAVGRRKVPQTESYTILTSLANDFLEVQTKNTTAKTTYSIGIVFEKKIKLGPCGLKKKKKKSTQVEQTHKHIKRQM